MVSLNVIACRIFPHPELCGRGLTLCLFHACLEFFFFSLNLSVPTQQTEVLEQENTLKVRVWYVLSILYSTVMVNVCFRISLLKAPPVCVLTLFPQKSPKGDLETFNSFYHSCISKREDSNSSSICLRWTITPLTSHTTLFNHHTGFWFSFCLNKRGTSAPAGDLYRFAHLSARDVSFPFGFFLLFQRIDVTQMQFFSH